MTLALAERERRRSRSRGPRLTFAGEFARRRLERAERRTRLTWPSSRYREDPVAFGREIIGVEPWSRQIEILEAIRDHQRVAVKSGHKVSKSHTIAIAALWFYCSFEDARAIMTSTTARQVDQILWRELRMMRARSGRCLVCRLADPGGRSIVAPCEHSALIDGDIGELARTGLKSADFREVVGFTAREAEAVAGISGKNLLYLPDEASGIADEIFEAIEGNRAGGARVAMFGNPTRTTGEFFDAFNSKKALYHCITVSSEETPNVVEGKRVIPGLATREWIEEKKQEWGEDSPLYRVRVKGEFATREDGKIFSIHAIEQSEQRWHETAETGRLFIGLDPAGPTGSGDETVFAIRRGLKLIALIAHRALSEEAHLVHLLSLITRFKVPRETPVVVVDREGSIGAPLAGILRKHVDGNRGCFELVALRASDKAHRQPQIYDRVRDELAANLEAWMRDGGAILEDVKLAAELHCLEWKQQLNARLKVTPKDVIRKELGRSPDRYDAVALSVWEPLSLKDDAPTTEAAQAATAHEQLPHGMDPYAGAATWEGRR